jgi:DNA adenine methylase
MKPAVKPTAKPTVKPIIKWAGGKARLAEQIDQAFGGPCKGLYCEPFLGGAAVFLHRRAIGHVQQAVLCDINSKLIYTYRAIRDNIEGVLSALDDLPKDDWKERYYEVRTQLNEGSEGSESRRAAQFLWLNRTCFNGLYRENRSGQFNVPCGSYKKINFPTRKHFLEVSGLLQGVALLTADFTEVMNSAGSQSQVYCDPPFVPLSATANFTAYSKGGFDYEQQEALAKAARQAAMRGAQVMLSNHDLPVVREELYPKEKGFRIVAEPKVARAISQKGDGRGKVGELIIAIGPLF